MFDETYYAKDALALFKFGAEHNVVKDADKILMRGGTRTVKRCAADLDKCAAYVVHPPLGKWMIGVGEQIFGMNPFGWRFAGGAGRARCPS